MNQTEMDALPLRAMERSNRERLGHGQIEPHADLINAIANIWRMAGIEEGDTVLLHSSLKRTFLRFAARGVDLTPDDLLDSFIEAVGREGTLLLPLFNFDFCDGAPFDIRSAPSQMGVLTEAARLRRGTVRTGHPVYSFGVIGKEARAFLECDNFSAYSDNSPFGQLRRMGGKIAVLDLPDQNSMAFYHHVEEIMGVPYRFHKRFVGKCTNWSGETILKAYGIFVRKEGVLTHVDPCGELLWQAGLYSGERPKCGNGLRAISASAMFDFVADIIKAGRAEGLLYVRETD